MATGFTALVTESGERMAKLGNASCQHKGFGKGMRTIKNSADDRAASPAISRINARIEEPKASIPKRRRSRRCGRRGWCWHGRSR